MKFQACYVFKLFLILAICKTSLGQLGDHAQCGGKIPGLLGQDDKNVYYLLLPLRARMECIMCPGSHMFRSECLLRPMSDHLSLWMAMYYGEHPGHQRTKPAAYLL